MPERKPCRCLLDESAPDLAALVREAVAALPEEEKAGAATYRDRLAVCRECPALRNGTCALCGCYVEHRAAKRRLACPDIPPRWTEERQTDRMKEESSWD